MLTIEQKLYLITSKFIYLYEKDENFIQMNGYVGNASTYIVNVGKMENRSELWIVTTDAITTYRIKNETFIEKISEILRNTNSDVYMDVAYANEYFYLLEPTKSEPPIDELESGTAHPTPNNWNQQTGNLNLQIMKQY